MLNDGDARLLFLYLHQDPDATTRLMHPSQPPSSSLSGTVDYTWLTAPHAPWMTGDSCSLGETGRSSNTDYYQQYIRLRRCHLHSQIVRLVSSCAMAPDHVLERIADLVDSAVQIAEMVPYRPQVAVPVPTAASIQRQVSQYLETQLLHPNSLTMTSAVPRADDPICDTASARSDCTQSLPEAESSFSTSPESSPIIWTKTVTPAGAQAPVSTTPQSSSSRKLVRKKRSIGQKNADARDLLKRMKEGINQDILYAPREMETMQPWDPDMSLSTFTATHWPEELNAYLSSAPPKLLEALRLGRAMEYVHNRCIQESGSGLSQGQDSSWTWKNWLQVHCVPHGIQTQVANRNRRIWRLMSNFPLMHLSSVSLRELNKNTCGIAHHLAKNPDEHAFWSQSVRGYLGSMVETESPAKKRKSSDGKRHSTTSDEDT